MDYIKSGYCIVTVDFYAYCVPFTTVNVEYAVNTVPWYTVKLPSGNEIGFNETQLMYTKEEVEEMCRKQNEEMKEMREDWLLNGLPATRRYEYIGR